MYRVDSVPKSDCCGCGLCAKLCPKDAIKMREGDDGFKYPSIDDEKCINCGICLKKCSFKNNDNAEFQDYYIARCIDNQVLKKSASGGIFSVLTNHYLPNSFIYGAAYDKDFSVNHIEAHDIFCRDRMRDSKYVQSSIENIFALIHKRLSDGEHVIFTGTPCQCSAVSNYLINKKIKRDNLLLVDIICHGVGSPRLWADYLSYVRNKFDIGNISSIITRNKEKGAGYHMTICGDKSCYYRDGVLDSYICLFNKSLIYRNSCYHCPYKSWNRVGDITIGDFQKVKKFFPKYADEKGVSVVLVNTNKGKKVFDLIKQNLIFDVASKESASQVNLSGGVLDEKSRNVFYSRYNLVGLEPLLLKYTNEGLLNFIKYKIKAIIKRMVRFFVK